MNKTQKDTVKHAISRLSVTLAMAGALAACGGGGDGGFNLGGGEPVSPAPAEARLSGQVRDANGVPIAGVRVVLENRSTDEVFGTVTEADGRYQVVAKPGVYDVLYDDVDRADWISLQHTAVDLRADRSDDAVLQRAGLVPSNELSGRLTDDSGAPMAGRRLLVIPSIVRSPAALGDVPMPGPLMVQTGAEGRFNAQLGQPGQDVELDVFLIAAEAPELDVAPLAVDDLDAKRQALLDRLEARREYPRHPIEEQLEAERKRLEAMREYLRRYVEEQLDVEKPDGAMQLDIIAGSDVRNLRSASGAPSVVPADAQALADQAAGSESRPVSTLGDAATRVAQALQRGLMALVPAAEAGRLINKFLPQWVNPDELLLENGRIDVTGNDQREMRLDDIVQADAERGSWETGLLRDTSFHLHNQVGWLDSLRGDNQIRFRTPYLGRFYFTDRTNDTYSLMVLNTSAYHTVNFRSKQPDIVKMRLTYRIGALPPGR